MKPALPKHLLRCRIHVFAGQQPIFLRHCLLHDAHCLRQLRTPIFNSVPTSCLPKTLTDHSPSIRTKPRISPGIRRVARPPQAHIIAPIAIEKKLHGSLCPVDVFCRWYFLVTTDLLTSRCLLFTASKAQGLAAMHPTALSQVSSARLSGLGFVALFVMPLSQQQLLALKNAVPKSWCK